MTIFNKSRISVQLFNLLKTEPPYNDNQKFICTADYTLREIDRLSPLNYREPNVAFVLARWLRKKFGSNYKQCMECLVRLGLCEVASYSYVIGVHPRSYRLTELGLSIVNDSNKTYLHALTNDSYVKLRVRKSITKRGVRNVEYSDPVLAYNYDGLLDTNFDLDKVPALMDELADKMRSEGRKEDFILRSRNAANLPLFALTEKRFDPLKYNAADSRLWTNYVSLAAAYRTLASYTDKNGNLLKRRAVTDMRCCHPTFFSLHILNCSESMDLTAEDRMNLLREHKLWVAQFTGDEDPRRRIAREIGVQWDTNEAKQKQLKKQLNKALNGSIKPQKVLDWLARTYPLLFKLWQQTNVKQTGPLISKYFESKLTLNPELYQLFDSLGHCKAFYEYDGFSLFFPPNDPDITSKCRAIEDKIRELSLKQFGFMVVLKTEYPATKSDNCSPPRFSVEVGG